MVRPPITESLEISFKSDTPLINEANIKGMAMSFKALINMVPKGLIQSEIKSEPKGVNDSATPSATPANIPIRICQCNAIFFIMYCN